MADLVMYMFALTHRMLMVAYSFGYRVRRVHQYPHTHAGTKKNAVIRWERRGTVCGMYPHIVPGNK